MIRRSHELSRAVGFALAALALTGAGSAAQGRGPRSAPPAGREIAEQAKAAKLDKKNASAGQFQGKSITFTPAILAPGTTLEQLEGGQVIGVMENDVAGDETGLPPGRYDVYAAKVGDQWHVYAEAGGQIVKEARRARLAGSDTPFGPKPRFKEMGWGYQTRVCVASILFGAVCVWYWDVFFDVIMQPTTASVAVGGTTKLTATVTDNGNPRTDLTGSLNWISSNPAVATVDATGLVKGVGTGTATITASYRYGQYGDTAGTAWATATVTVGTPQAATTTTTRYTYLEYDW